MSRLDLALLVFGLAASGAALFYRVAWEVVCEDYDRLSDYDDTLFDEISRYRKKYGYLGKEEAQ